jgi:hypothetical protein
MNTITSTDSDTGTDSLTDQELCRLVEMVGGPHVVRRILSGLDQINISPVEIMGPIASIVVEPLSGRFIPTDNFSTGNKKIKLSFIGSGFRQNFLQGESDGGVIENPTEASKIIYFGDLISKETDSIIIQHLGEESVELMLSDICFLLEKNSSSEKSFLPKDVAVNVFYARNFLGDIKPVHLYPHNGGYGIDSFELDFSTKLIGYRVFFRK